MELFRLVEDSMMRVNACMLQMHWKGPLCSFSAVGRAPVEFVCTCLLKQRDESQCLHDVNALRGLIIKVLHLFVTAIAASAL